VSVRASVFDVDPALGGNLWCEAQPDLRGLEAGGTTLEDHLLWAIAVPLKMDDVRSVGPQIELLRRARHLRSVYEYPNARGLEVERNPLGGRRLTRHGQKTDQECDSPGSGEPCNDAHSHPHPQARCEGTPLRWPAGRRDDRLARPMAQKPDRRPARPHFSSGPCAKRPGWSPDVLSRAMVGRSHRAKPAVARIQAVSDASRRILGMPDDYRLGLVPGSDTGAMELALWSLLGQRGAHLLAWESFGQGWITDVVKQLGLEDALELRAEYGELPDLTQVDFARDVVFTWNGTTSGVRVPDGDWIDDDREGLTVCDATSAVFAMELPWQKLDVVTWSWQKVLGGEAAHGMLALSPRAVERLETYTPPWPLPKLFRLAKGGKLTEGVFQGSTINTPSMLCVEDAIDALAWAEEIGGRAALQKRSQENLDAIARWVAESDWIEFLARDPATRSSTSICLRIVDPWFREQDEARQTALAKEIGSRLDAEGVAHDIGSYRDAPAGLRIWGGATVETSDVEALLPWLDWAWAEVREGP
jgi:phosphoserine aminotransferase